MTSDNRKPFIDSRAFEKANSTYVPFPSQAAMLASLQLFHDVPCRIMDLVFSVVTHPDFDSKQLNLRSSLDVIDVVEESRLKDRLAFVQERSVSGDGRVEQAGLPQFILDEVLDIIHTDRMTSIKARFEERLDAKAMYSNSMYIEEDDTLKAMTRVHRSWTILAQKALGRVLHIGRPTRKMNVLLSPVRKSIFGPWTAVVAVEFYHPITKKTRNSDISYTLSSDVRATDGKRKWFENLHLILLGFTNLKCLYIKSYASLFTRWSDLTFGEMVRRNVRLEEVTLYSIYDQSFNLDPLLDNASALKSLRSLSTQGAQISNLVVRRVTNGPCFASLNHLTIIRSCQSLEYDFGLLSLLSSRSNFRLESLRIIDHIRRRQTFQQDIDRVFVPSQCTAIFAHVHSLHIDGKESADQWFRWIGPYCLNLDSLSIVDRSRRASPEENVRRALSSLQNAQAIVFPRLCTLRINCKAAADLWLDWIGPFCSSLQSLTFDLDVSIPPDVLDLIPITVCNLHLTLLRERDTTIEEINGWMTHLLKIPSYKNFSMLKSFTLVLSDTRLQVLQSSKNSKQQAQSLRTEIKSFKEEMSAVCEGVRIKCYLKL